MLIYEFRDGQTSKVWSSVLILSLYNTFIQGRRKLFYGGGGELSNPPCLADNEKFKITLAKMPQNSRPPKNKI